MNAVQIVAATLAGAGAQPAYPADAIYGAYADACADVADLEKASTSLPGKGWEAFEPAPESESGQLLERGRSMTAQISPGTKLRPMRAFRKTVAGEHLELILSGVETDGQWTNGCRVYDFGETRHIPMAFMEKKLGRAPKETAAQPDVLEKAVWEPGYRPDHLSAELYFVPQGSPVIKLIGSSGICIVAQATGEI